MAFPSSPTNGQTSVINGILYTYNSTSGVWSRSAVSGSTISLTANTLTVSNATVLSSTLNVSGGTILAGMTATTGAFSSTLSVTGNTTAGNVTASGTLGVTGATTLSSTLGVTGATTLSSTLGVTGLITSTGGISGGAASHTTGTFSSTVQTTGIGVGTTPPGTAGQILATNSITAFYSDARLKTEISKIENALDKVDQLTGILYTQNELAETFGYNNYETQVGLRAQDVQIVQPEAVKPAPFDTAKDGSSKSGENYLTVQYEKLVPLLVEAIKELRVELNMLKGQK